MYAQIVIGCQTQNEIVSCEYCIAYKMCQLHKGLEIDKEKFAQIETKESPLLFSTITQQMLTH